MTVSDQMSHNFLPPSNSPQMRIQFNHRSRFPTRDRSSFPDTQKPISMSAGDVILLIMAAILPPLPVAIKRGICSGAFFLNLILSILAYIPGMIHAWYIILKYPEHIHGPECARNAQRDLERNATTGTFPGQVYQPVAQPRVQGGNMDGVYGNQAAHAQQQQQQHQQQQQLLSAGGKSYGAAGSAQQEPPAYSPSDVKD